MKVIHDDSTAIYFMKSKHELKNIFLRYSNLNKKFQLTFTIYNCNYKDYYYHFFYELIIFYIYL